MFAITVLASKQGLHKFASVVILTPLITSQAVYKYLSYRSKLNFLRGNKSV